MQGIESVLNDEIYILKETKSDAMMPSYYDDAPKANGAAHGENAFNLSPREQDVLEHLMLGAPNKEIARALGLQVVTVKPHIHGICKKLGAKNRTQAALIAQTHFQSGKAAQDAQQV